MSIDEKVTDKALENFLGFWFSTYVMNVAFTFLSHAFLSTELAIALFFMTAFLQYIFVNHLAYTNNALLSNAQLHLRLLTVLDQLHSGKSSNLQQAMLHADRQFEEMKGRTDSETGPSGSIIEKTVNLFSKLSTHILERLFGLCFLAVAAFFGNRHSNEVRSLADQLHGKLSGLL